MLTDVWPWDPKGHKSLLLTEHYLPCYTCCNFRHKSAFSNEYTIDGYKLGGSQATGGSLNRFPRICKECYLKDREIAISEIITTGTISHKLVEWDERYDNTGYYAVQRAPFGLYGWVILSCEQCGQHSFQDVSPWPAQADAGKCMFCFSGCRQIFTEVRLAESGSTEAPEDVYWLEERLMRLRARSWNMRYYKPKFEVVVREESYRRYQQVLGERRYINHP